jgi:hypothetical protein
MTALCFTCQDAPAGSAEKTLANSAFCPGCQPAPEPERAYAFFGCGLCHQVFGTLTLFDSHHDTDYDRRPVIICRDPAALGAVSDHRGVWQTPEGLARRQDSAERGRAWVRARALARRQDASSGPATRALAAAQGHPGVTA